MPFCGAAASRGGGRPLSSSRRPEPQDATDPAGFWKRWRGRRVVIETAYAQTPILHTPEEGPPGQGPELDAVLTTWRRIQGVVEAVAPAPPGLVLRDVVEQVVFQEVAAGSGPPAGSGDIRETKRLPRKFVAFAVMETVDFPEEE